MIGARKSALSAGLLTPSPKAIKTTVFNLFYPGFSFAMSLLSPRSESRLQFLLLQIKILKTRLKSDRVSATFTSTRHVSAIGLGTV